MAVSPNINSFNSGEWSELTAGRVDLPNYSSSCRKMLNCIPSIVGPCTKRGGTEYLGNAKVASDRCTFIPWEFSRDEAYALELGDSYMRIWRNNGQAVESAPSTPLELVTPWTADEAKDVQWAQNADVMYICHPNKRTQLLKRFSDTNWTIEDFLPNKAPTLDENIDEALTITASATTGAITLVASGPVFDPAHVGSVFRFRSVIPSEYSQWQADETGISIGDRRWDFSSSEFSQRNVYQSLSSGKSGTQSPSHDSGIESDGLLNWRFEHSEYGYVRITSVIDSQNATADVLSTLPTSATTGTFRWSEGAWSDFRGYPRAVTFFERRLWFGYTRSEPQDMWASQVNAFDDFELNIFSTSAINYTLATDRINAITFLSANRVLVIGTSGGEFIGRGGSSASEPITALNASFTRQTEYGSSPQQMSRAGSSVLFMQRNKASVREFQYAFDRDNYVARDMNTLADHIGTLGLGRTAYQQEPDRALWSYTDSGQLVAMTYEPEEQVIGWHQHTLSGVVESVIAIPSSDGNRDDVWVVVKRNISGSDIRHIERISPQTVYVDSYIHYQGPAISVITGLDHLEGKEVYAVTNGAVDGLHTVTSGQITLNGTSSDDVFVGLPYTMDLRPQLIEGGSRNGVSQGKNKRILNIVYRLYKTGPGLYHGTREDNLELIPFRSTTHNMDQAVPPFTGDTDRKPLPGGSRDKGSVILQHRLPQSCTVIAMYPKMSTEDDR
jgi:hypothetical protein